MKSRHHRNKGIVGVLTLILIHAVHPIYGQTASSDWPRRFSRDGVTNIVARDFEPIGVQTVQSRDFR